ncbi:MAG: hypothetical protein K2X77_14995 [Candidatus Obscuribacterales bacterium]|jgi:hypothetical protein|nr:hypothetical protein [Candidatus Obscuribacterales bacterium]
MIEMSDQLSAQISLLGMLLDAAGGLFLAYDLLGGEKGPLSTFTRMFTYSCLSVLFYGLAMGLRFGLIVGISIGSCLGLHLERLGKDKKDTPLFMFSISLVRAVALGSAVYLEGHPIVATIGGCVVFAASMLLPFFKLGPAMLIEKSSKKPSLNKKKVGFAVLLGALVACTDILCVQFANVTKQDMSHMVRLSATVVMATLIISAISPTIEWYADNVEPKVLGYLGTILFIVGFMLQAFPSLVTVLS